MSYNFLARSSVGGTIGRKWLFDWSKMRACHRCGRAGHLSRDCFLHACFRCNRKGHMAWECVEGVTCGKCGEKGHFQRNCKNMTCHKCRRRGHISKFCSDPFVKAAEAEKLEHQLVQLKKEKHGASNSDSKTTLGNNGSRKFSEQRKPDPSLWDGLGDGKRKARPCLDLDTTHRKRTALAIRIVLSGRGKPVPSESKLNQRPHVAEKFGEFTEENRTKSGLVCYDSESSDESEKGMVAFETSRIGQDHTTVASVELQVSG